MAGFRTQRRKFFALLFFALSTIVCLGLYENRLFLLKKENTQRKQRFPLGVDTLTLALAVRASEVDGSVVLALVDSSYVDMAVNFYVTSIARHSIDNFLFLSTDEEGCQALTRELPHDSVPCFPVVEDVAGDLVSKYGTHEFARKLDVRMRVMLHALRMGLTVLNTDTDVVYLQDPLQELFRVCGVGCDLSTMMATEGNRHNAGFMYIRPTNPSILFLESARALFSNHGIVDQTAMNKILKRPEKFVPGGVEIHEVRLPLDRYLVGNRYFVRGERTFLGEAPCPKCMVVHNNQIRSKDGKVHRFKEMGLWEYDGGRYYSSPTRKYIVYANPLRETSRGGDVTDIERLALANALAIGVVLDRTVIMPRFHCTKRDGPYECSLLHILGEKGLEVLNSYTEISYRESTFLRHRLVPKSLTASRERVYFIQNSHIDRSFLPSQCRLLTPSQETGGPTRSDILSWFGENNLPLIRFVSLYGKFSNLKIIDILPKDVTNVIFRTAN